MIRGPYYIFHRGKGPSTIQEGGLANADCAYPHTRSVVIVSRRVKHRTIVPDRDIVFTPFDPYLDDAELR